MSATPPVYILGFMGSGKTTVGKQLARQMKYDFVDLDNVIEQSVKKSIKEIFKDHGEIYFRQLEADQLKKTLSYTATVISCGGGTPCFFDNLKLMNENGITIYLKMNARELLSRLIDNKLNRPLLDGKSDDELLNYIEALLNEREVFYSNAQHIISGLNLKVKDLLKIIQS